MKNILFSAAVAIAVAIGAMGGVSGDAFAAPKPGPGTVSEIGIGSGR